MATSKSTKALKRKSDSGYFEVHQLADIENETAKVIVHVGDNGHVSITPLKYQSGTQLRGNAAKLLATLGKRVRKATLHFGTMIIDLPLPLKYEKGTKF